MTVVEQFPYRDRNPASGGLDLMPDLPITLRYQLNSMNAVGLVDSGASISVLPYSLGIQLGFDWDTQKAQITLGGTLAHTASHPDDRNNVLIISWTDRSTEDARVTRIISARAAKPAERKRYVQEISRHE
jgi:hypothetical protein